MADTQDLVKRNGEFEAAGFRADLVINPFGSWNLVILPLHRLRDDRPRVSSALAAICAEGGGAWHPPA